MTQKSSLSPLRNSLFFPIPLNLPPPSPKSQIKSLQHHLLQSKTVKPKTRSFFAWCQFQTKGWFKLEVALNGLHGIGIPSMLFSIGIHSLKENSLAKKDAEIKRKILDVHTNRSEDFFSEDVARVIRRDVTKNIPTALNNAYGFSGRK